MNLCLFNFFTKTLTKSINYFIIIELYKYRIVFGCKFPSKSLVLQISIENIHFDILRFNRYNQIADKSSKNYLQILAKLTKPDKE